MSVSVEKLEHNLAKMTIEIPVETIEKAIDKVYKQQRNRIQVPGFRKGKAPRKMIEKMYGKGIFLEDAINECVPEEYEKACEESGLDIVSQPKIEYTQTEPDMPVIFEATVAVRPEVTLGEYKGLEVEVEEKTVTDEDVDADIRSEQEKNATTEEVTDR
ncbi:MAG: trigger factor family protein, partial [Lachnospiraceae bacterium]|nr:trigger factor family protein [Lachnospiraceae bacterium]